MIKSLSVFYQIKYCQERKKKESWDSINGCEHFRGISKWLEVYYSWWSCLQKVMLGSFYRLFSSRSGNKVRSQSDIKPAGLFLQCATEQRSLLCLGIQITAFLQKQHVLDRQCQDQNPTIAHCSLGLLKDNTWFCSILGLLKGDIWLREFLTQLAFKSPHFCRRSTC